jgi:hypothetical protein
VLQPSRETLELALQALVLEARHAPADLADGVVVVLASGDYRLVAGHSFAELDPLHEAELVEEVDGAVDAGDADVVLGAPQLVGDLLGGEAAGLPAEKADDRLARASGAVAGVTQRLTRGVLPLELAGTAHAGSLAH